MTMSYQPDRGALPPVLSGHEGADRRRRQRPLDRLGMRPGDASGRRRDRDDLSERQGAAPCRAVGARGRGALLLPLEVRDDAQVDALFEAIAQKWGRLDILVHSIAFAPRQALAGRVTDCPRDGFLTAMDISCWSFLDLARRAEKLMTGGGTMFAMSYHGANEVIENYGIMGPVKAALESAVRYMAAELGPRGIRVHAISPGPLATRAASGIPDFDALMERVADRAPARRLVTIEEVGAACVFLACPYGARDDRRHDVHRRRLSHSRLKEHVPCRTHLPSR